MNEGFSFLNSTAAMSEIIRHFTLEWKLTNNSEDINFKYLMALWSRIISVVSTNDVTLFGCYK